MKLKAEFIEVCGLTSIIIDKKYRWVKTTGKLGKRVVDVWLLQTEKSRSTKFSNEMATYVNNLLSDPSRRAWIGEASLNIVMKDTPKTAHSAVDEKIPNPITEKYGTPRPSNKPSKR